MAQKPQLPVGKRILIISALGLSFGTLAALVAFQLGVNVVGVFLTVGALVTALYGAFLGRKYPVTRSEGNMVALGSAIGYVACFFVGGVLASGALGVMHAVTRAF